MRLPPLLLALLIPGVVSTTAAVEAEAFKLSLEETGIYRVDYEELEAAGLDHTVASAGLSLSVGGRVVPLWIEDGGDGDFGPGDHVEFLGDRLAGQVGHFNDFSRFNVYWLETRSPEARGAVRSEPEPPACEPTQASGLWGLEHFEQDKLRVRLRSQAGTRPEIWYWARLAHADKEAFDVPLHLADLDLESETPVELRLHFKGISRVPHKAGDGVATDHVVEVQVDGQVWGTGAWDNSSDGYLLDGIEVPASELAAGASVQVKVPKRRGEDGWAIDVSMLNWIEVAYPRRSSVTAGLDLRLAAGADSLCLAPAGTATVMTPDGRRLSFGGRRRLPADLAGGPTTAVARLALGELRRVEQVVAEKASDLAGTERQADYLMISHPSLLSAASGLAEFHGARGLSVELIDVTDIYDEFNYGVVDPSAIRAFLAHAYHAWQEPRPRFVLLVGDASWDLSDEPVDDANYANMSFELAREYGRRGRRSPGNHQFSRQRIRAYDEAGPATWRNLIPTWAHGTLDGPAASDNWFVNVEGNARPEMAIGRFPVVTPEEVLGIVEKTLAFARRSAGEDPAALMVTDHYDASKGHADVLAARLEEEGFSTTRIYPQVDGPASRQHLLTVVDAFDLGPDLVYFVGHGGRYEWRTGRADLSGQTDLFTLDHLDQLAEQESGHLPVVLSVACYSAPFDHPGADSIGEKLLRVPGRGAVAVVAAAWRITPSVATGQALVEQLMVSPTIGDAVMAVKTTHSDFQFVVQFNLLGDPALPLAGWRDKNMLENGASVR